MDYADHLMHLFREKGAYLEGHFVLSSGLHSPNYMQCARVLQFPSIAGELGQRLATHFTDVDLVLSPAMGGIIIGHEVARALNVPFIFCERVEKQFQLRRGFQIEPGRRVVVVEDVVTTGLSTGETIAVAEQAGAKVVGVAAIVDRSTAPLPFSVPFHSLVRLPLATHKPEACPLCAQNIPVVKPGSRKF
jgi:orotate phosphoribosyltransferase